MHQNLNQSVFSSWLLFIAGLTSTIMPIVQFLCFITGTLVSVLAIITWFKKNNSNR